ncbi:HNH endonuclease [Bacillus velezensis]|uniref:HNH endonuclease n=2 Tax=Bacillus velezensis TaxID=492670 RepID=UPI0009AE3B8D|nr:HNH endonuclease [Bacillus velezensis]PQB09119.1 HNH endonuclease [Bacillus velezensis]TWO89691.1 HNH endonuclease [Bacillus velezensis]
MKFIRRKMQRTMIDKKERRIRKATMPLSNKRVKTCEICRAEMYVKASHYSRRKTCSRECAAKRKSLIQRGASNPNYGNRGPKNPLFKSGVRISRYGYKLIYKPHHPNSQKDGYILEHRYVMSEYLKRPLKEDEHVHHKDENKLNNDVSNLELVTRSEHSSLHNRNKTIPRDSETGRFIRVVNREDE